MSSNPDHSLKLGYNNASFQGRYGFSIIYGPRVAVGVGVAISDGKGNFHGIQNFNVGGNYIPQKFVGTYEINEDGTGTAYAKLTAPDGSVQEGAFDYVTLQAFDGGGVKTATELQGMTRQPLNGYYVISWFKRLP